MTKEQELRESFYCAVSPLAKMRALSIASKVNEIEVIANKIAWELVDNLMRDVKFACYLKAERELPESKLKQAKLVDGSRGIYGLDNFHCTTEYLSNFLEGYNRCQQEMLQEVDGVAFRACEEFKD